MPLIGAANTKRKRKTTTTMGKLSDIQTGRQNKPPRVVLYGVEGIGKSTWAANAPNPIFIQTEDGLSEIECAKFPLSQSLDDVLDNIKVLGTEEHDYKTVVIDSADWLEPLIIQQVCKEYGVDTLQRAAGGYGNGTVKLVDKWGTVLDALNWLRLTKGMGVIIIAHSSVKTFNDPENPPYDRYQLRLAAKSNDLLMEWADAVLFATRKMAITRDDSGKAKAQAIGKSGGERIVRTNASPACAAKNRYNLPDELPLDYAAFAQAITK